MGACISSCAKAKSVPGIVKSDPFPITIAFPICAPLTLSVCPSDKVASIRRRMIAEMERRADSGESFVKIEGTLVTVDGNTGDNVHLRDAATVHEAKLESGQYLWIQDKTEDRRVENLLRRSSRLTENTSHNSRGVKQGMALIREEAEYVVPF